jgi:hypothetical protein
MGSIIPALPSSYRDPSGFVFEREGILYRQVNLRFKTQFDHFIRSGCYDALVKEGLLIPHQEIDQDLSGNGNWYKTLRPERVPFISYPYEWSFDMLKNAALLTLRVLNIAMEHGMILKDATPYNIQWYKGRLIFIDTLSFEIYEEKPWIAYRQFCEQFLSPLLLMHYSKTALPSLSLAWMEGVPLQVASRLLPFRSRFSLHTFLHIHLHAKMSRSKAGHAKQTAAFSRQKMQNLLTSLSLLVTKLRNPVQPSTWQHYYAEAGTRSTYLDTKKEMIKEWVKQLKEVRTAADLGANDGVFSRIVAEAGIDTLAADGDPYCINALYLDLKRTRNNQVQPLIMDLDNPSPATGFNNKERDSFLQRLNPDLIVALAVIHHLAIGKNIPMEQLALFFSSANKYLLIEFVPKEDSKVQLLLQHKPDIYDQYAIGNFIQVFGHYFSIIKQEMIGESGRTLFLLEKKHPAFQS